MWGEFEESVTSKFICLIFEERLSQIVINTSSIISLSKTRFQFWNKPGWHHWPISPSIKSSTAKIKLWIFTNECTFAKFDYRLFCCMLGLKYWFRSKLIIKFVPSRTKILHLLPIPRAKPLSVLWDSLQRYFHASMLHMWKYFIIFFLICMCSDWSL